MSEEILVEIRLVGNPRVSSNRVFVAEIEGDRLKFLRAVIPKFEKGTFMGGKYLVKKEKYYILKGDDSSWKHSRTYYQLFKVKNEDVETLATIGVVDRNLRFEPKELEEIYVDLKAKGERNLVINTLIKYSKRLSE